MRRGSLVSDLVVIVESLYKDRVRAMQLGEVESGNQDWVIAGGHECMQVGRSSARVLASDKSLVPSVLTSRNSTGEKRAECSVVQRTDDKEPSLVSHLCDVFNWLNPMRVPIPYSSHVHRPRCGQNLTLKLPENE